MNRSYVATKMGGIADNLCTLKQIHSAEVVTVKAPWTNEISPQADAMVTNNPDILLGILTADCTPILFADPEKQIIGAAHAGWKGAIGGVLEATIAAMEKLGSSRENIHAAIGPCIAQESYEVGEEFYERFIEVNSEYKNFFKIPDSRYHFNLPAFNQHILQKSGIQNIDIIARDTYAEEDIFFSFRRATLRREPDYGRQISVIGIMK